MPARHHRRLVHEFRLRLGVSNPVRKVYYNITITGLSVVAALLSGSVELLGLLASQLGWSGGFWSWLGGIDLNAIGFLIVGLFVVTWVGALLIWRYARIEEKWTVQRDGQCANR